MKIHGRPSPYTAAKISASYGFCNIEAKLQNFNLLVLLRGDRGYFVETGVYSATAGSSNNMCEGSKTVPQAGTSKLLAVQYVSDRHFSRIF